MPASPVRTEGLRKLQLEITGVLFATTVFGWILKAFISGGGEGGLVGGRDWRKKSPHCQD